MVFLLDGSLAGSRLVKKKACVGDERGVDGDFALGITALCPVREPS